jgi:hypothetical protein
MPIVIQEKILTQSRKERKEDKDPHPTKILSNYCVFAVLGGLGDLGVR